MGGNPSIPYRETSTVSGFEGVQCVDLSHDKSKQRVGPINDFDALVAQCIFERYQAREFEEGFDLDDLLGGEREALSRVPPVQNRR